MAIVEQFFTDILGKDRHLSTIMNVIKEWVVSAEYAGLTNVDDWTPGAMNYFLLFISGLIKYDLESYADELIRLAFPVTSAGDFLDKIYARNGVYRKDGEYATTSLRWELLEDDIESDIVIEAGTEVGTDEAITYYLVEDLTIPKDETIVYGLVQCEEVGIIGNVRAGTIVNVFTELNFDLRVINENDVTSGVDIESDDDFKARARDYAIEGVSVGTDLWIERIAKTLVDDALCYDLDASTKLLVYKPTTGVSRRDLEDLFERKEYRTRSSIIIQEAEAVVVIDSTKRIKLLIEKGAVHSPIVNIMKTRVNHYVDKKINLGGVFKPICLKRIGESIEKVTYVELTGFDNNIDLTNYQYAVIEELNITTESED
jgi:hypothetical protein